MKPVDSRPERKARNREGAVAIVLAITLVALLGVTALSVDVGYMMVSRNELQNISDGSSLAATRKLGEIYREMPPEQQPSYDATNDADDIISTAVNLAQKNSAGGKDEISLNSSDVEIGRWYRDSDTGNYSFTPTLAQPDAVRVTSRRDALANGPVATYFARVFGVDSYPVTSVAVAALTGQGSADPGDLELPVGINEVEFDSSSDFCREEITFHPTGTSCAGWTTFDISPSNPNTLEDIMEAIQTNGELNVNDSDLNFSGGDLASIFDTLLLLFKDKGHDLKPESGDMENDCPPPLSPDEWEEWYSYETLDALVPVEMDGEGVPVPGHSGEGLGCPLYGPWDGTGSLEDVRLLYPDGTNPHNGTPRNFHKWETTVVVYEKQGDETAGDCQNPNQTRKLLGFADIVLYEVLDAPDKTIRAFVLCNRVDNDLSRGGGGDYGVKGSIPNLVQ